MNARAKGALDHDEWCICSTEYRATHGDAHTRICSQQWGDLTRLIDGVRRKAEVDALREYRDALAGNESAEDWIGRDAFLHDLGDWINEVER